MNLLNPDILFIIFCTDLGMPIRQIQAVYFLRHHGSWTLDCCLTQVLHLVELATKKYALPSAHFQSFKF